MHGIDYREVVRNGETVYELAATEWKESDPEAVTEWFISATKKSPDETNGRQLRRMVRLLKAWSKSRASWTLPSGFVLSILTDEKYPHGGWKDRDDHALYYLVCDIHARLQVNRTVIRPVKPHDSVTKTNDDADMRNLRDKLGDAKANPQCTKELARSTYFESVGHSYLKAYGDVLGAINGSCDFTKDEFPDPARWDPEWYRLRNERCDGFFYGSMPPLAKVGLVAIFEGQARFSQIQFLASSGGPALLQTYREQGYFTPLYADAFEEFLRITGREWPERFDSPVVALFLLICDLAINPTRGFPLDIRYFDDFIRDVDPGARFTRLCLAAAEAPELAFAIQKFNAIEYEYVAMRLTERCGYDDPREALDAVIALIGDDGPVDALMEEHRTFEYGLTNMPIRVMVSHYIAFCRDKRKRPEFFCWPGVWMAASKATAELQSLFLTHLSLFQDRADTAKIFPRAMPGKSSDSLRRLVNDFYSSMLLFDMALQWVVAPGPFCYDFSWLTGESDNPELVMGAKRQFVQFYGLDPDSFDLIDSPDVPTAD